MDTEIEIYRSLDEQIKTETKVANKVEESLMRNISLTEQKKLLNIFEDTFKPSVYYL